MLDAAPHPALAGLVERYTDYSERTGSFTARRELATTGGVMIVNLGKPLEIIGADGGMLRLEAGQGFAGGLAEATSISRSTGSQQGIHIWAPLEMLGGILGCPPAEIANRVVSLADAVGRDGREIGERLAEARSAEERFACLDAFLARRLQQSRPDRRIAMASRLLRHRPDMPIEALAGQLDLDRRSFAREFRRTLGLSPRRFARLARFEHFVKTLGTHPAASLAELAVAAGYYDQPHLNREVRAFAAMTPGELQSRTIAANGGVRHE